MVTSVSAPTSPSHPSDHPPFVDLPLCSPRHPMQYKQRRNGSQNANLTRELLVNNSSETMHSVVALAMSALGVPNKQVKQIRLLSTHWCGVECYLPNGEEIKCKMFLFSQNKIACK